MFVVSKEIEEYAARYTTPLPPLLEELTRATYESMELPQMLTGQLEGTLLQFLVAIAGARSVLEIGMFTGFSAQMMAAALPENGRLITCEMNPKARDFAVPFLARSPHGKKIEVRPGPALETLKTLTGPFDLVFIDADKGNYVNYYERSLEILAPHGLIAVDNVLWSGRVLDPKDEGDRTMAAFNEHVRNDPRVQNVILTVRDGVMLVRKV